MSSPGLSLFELGWILFCLTIPLTIAGANGSWSLACLALIIWSLRKPAPLTRHSERTPTWRDGLSFLTIPVVLYCLAAAAASMFGTDPKHSFHFFYQDAHKAWLCFFFSLCLAQLPKTDDDLLLGALAIGTIAGCALGIVQMLIDHPSGLWIRPHAFVHPVTFGEITAMVVLGAFVFGLKSDGPRRKAAWALLAVAGIALFLNQTRGAIASVVAGIFLAAIVDRRLKFASLGAGFAAALALVASDFLPTGRSLIEGISKAGAASTPQLDRLKLWQVAWRMFLDHPWTGVGVNNYRSNFNTYFTGLINNESAMGTAHNLYLHQLAERGIIGFGALCLLFAALWKGAFIRAKASPDAWNLWAFSATAAFTVMNMTETALQTEQVWMFFFFIWIWSEKHGRCECAE